MKITREIHPTKGNVIKKRLTRTALSRSGFDWIFPFKFVISYVKQDKELYYLYVGSKFYSLSLMGISISTQQNKQNKHR